MTTPVEMRHERAPDPFRRDFRNVQRNQHGTDTHRGSNEKSRRYKHRRSIRQSRRHREHAIHDSGRDQRRPASKTISQISANRSSHQRTREDNADRHLGLNRAEVKLAAYK
jgi:hypothetical protein